MSPPASRGIKRSCKMLNNTYRAANLYLLAPAVLFAKSFSQNMTTGHATKTDEYVPVMVPTSMVKAKS